MKTYWKSKGIENRKAKFVSVITLAKPNGDTYSFEGEILGEIIDSQGEIQVLDMTLISM